MNIEDFIRNSNSWHWLVAVIVVSAVTSVFMPEWGWRDVLTKTSTPLAAVEKGQMGRLAEVRSLAALDVSAIDAQTAKAKRELSSVKAEFAKLGIEELPADDSAVFSAQSRIADALNKRNLRIVSTEAKVAEITPRAVPASAVKTVEPQKKLTVAEYRRQLEASAAEMKDEKMRNMMLADGRRILAKLEAEEKKAGASAGRRPSAPPVGQKPGVVTSSSSAKLPFKTETIDYNVVGDFKNIFMFFVAETHKKPSYNFKDISVVRSEGGKMDLSFVLQVNHR